METINAEDIIIIEEKEPVKSKEIFKEYSKQNKTLKQIATEKGIPYNTAKQYSSNYKYKQRLELNIELETSKLATKKQELIKEHEEDLKETLNKSYETLLYAVRNSKGAEVINLDYIQNIGVYFEEDTDYKAFNNWSKTALNNMKLVNETLKAIETIEDKLSII